MKVIVAIAASSARRQHDTNIEISLIDIASQRRAKNALRCFFIRLRIYFYVIAVALQEP